MNATTVGIVATGEHEFEAAPGLPQPLPQGERLLWQGSPDWRLLARDGMRLNWLIGYFVVLLTWRAAGVAGDGGSSMDIARAVGGGTALALVAIGLVLTLAWLVARTAVYTITDRRIVMSIGVVLSVSFNLPLKQIEAAVLRVRRDGSGDIALALADGQRIAYLHLWPHARPWQLKRTQPMLRGLRDARRVGALLVTAKDLAKERGA